MQIFWVIVEWGEVVTPSPYSTLFTQDVLSTPPQILLQPLQQHLIFITPLRLIRGLLQLQHRMFVECHRTPCTINRIKGIHRPAAGALHRLQRGRALHIDIDEARVLQHLPLDVTAGEVDVDLRHGAVLLPAGDEPELHLRETLRGAIGPHEISKPGVPDGMGVNRFGDVQLFGEVLEPVFHGPAAQPSGRSTIGPRGYEEGGCGVVPERVDVHPGLQVGDRPDEPEPAHPSLASDDDDRTVFVELDVADVEVEEFGYAGPGVPHEHDEGPVPWLFADFDEPGDVGSADELIDGEVPAGFFYFDVLKEFLFLLRVEPPEEEFDLKDVALEGEGADGLSPLDEVVLNIFLGELHGITVAGVTEKGKDSPDLGADGCLFELFEFEVADVAFEVFAVGRVETLHEVEFLVAHIHTSDRMGFKKSTAM